MTNLIRILLAFLCLAASAPAAAAGQSSTNFAIPRDAVNEGIADIASTNFRMASSVGDTVGGATLGSTNFLLRSGFRASAGAPPPALALLSVVSRKTHGATGTFDLPIDTTQALGGLITVEPRAIGPGHDIVFQFNAPVISLTAATAIDSGALAVGTVATALAGNELTVNLTGVPQNQRLTVSVTGVNGVLDASASLGFLVGDVNNTRSVNSSDISGVKVRSGQATDATNFKFDLNASGAINSTDISAVKARSGQGLNP